MNFLSSEKHVFETFRELAVFVEVHNFGYLKKNDIFNGYTKPRMYLYSLPLFVDLVVKERFSLSINLASVSL